MYNQHNQVLAEQPKLQHQEEPVISHHVDAKENQEPIKKENIPITEGMNFNSSNKTVLQFLVLSGLRIKCFSSYKVFFSKQYNLFIINI